MPIPDQLVTATQADVALRTFLDWTYGIAETRAKGDLSLFLIADPIGVTARRDSFLQLKRLDDLLHELSRNPGPGPAAVGRDGWIGQPLNRPTSYRVATPAHSPYGLTITEPISQLAAVVTDVQALRVLAARCARCAEVDRTAGRRNREADRLDHEAGELIAYASDHEQHVRPLGDAFLDLWRAEAARHEPAQPARPVVRPLQLRQNGSSA